ncbi:MAG: hypothetical protein HY423_06240 [Candidatus Lambdaproteobacteria bacterium]|nr:hypothetical protein [Candidatus Lambdaproteobacteria bacterium]
MSTSGTGKQTAGDRLRDRAVPRPKARGITIGVRFKFGDELETLELLGDGLVFRSPAPIAGGRIVELILCEGTILVDAMVVQCRPYDDLGHHAVQVRYHQVSKPLQALIGEEVARSAGLAEPRAVPLARHA